MKLKLGISKRTLLIIFGLIIAGGTSGYLFYNRGAKAEDFLTAKIEKGDIRNTVSATGALQAVTTVQVGSQVSGTIAALYADFNTQVKKGQVVAQLEPDILQAQVAQNRANVEQAKASVADAKASVLAAESTVDNQKAGVSSAAANLAALKAQRDDAARLVERQRALAESGIIAERDLESVTATFNAADARYRQAAAQLDQAKVGEQSAIRSGIEQARAQLQQAQAQLQQAQAQLKLAEVNLSHTTITSPINGVVVARSVDVGQTVAASLSAPTLFTIANDLTQMQVIASIDQADIGTIDQNNRVSFTVDAFPGQTFNGSINQIRLNAVNVSNVVTYNVVVDVKNPELKLKPGMTANLTFGIAERNGVLKLPNAALRFKPQDLTQEKIREMMRNTAGNESGGPGKQENAQTTEAPAKETNPTETPERRRRRDQQSQQPPNGSSDDGGGRRDGSRGGFAPSTAAVIEGQRRIVWVLGPDNKPQPRRIQIGITDGVSTEILQGDLKEGDMVIVGQNITGDSRPQSRQNPPGFGGMPGGGGRGGGGGGGGRGPR